MRPCVGCGRRSTRPSRSRPFTSRLIACGATMTARARSAADNPGSRTTTDNVPNWARLMPPASRTDQKSAGCFLRERRRVWNEQRDQLKRRIELRGHAFTHHHRLQQQREVAGQPQSMRAYDAHELGEQRPEVEVLERQVGIALEKPFEIALEPLALDVVARDPEA